MQAVESLRAGKLEESLAELKEQIKANPSDAKQRVFLFQLLSVAGEWDRALTQLNVAGDMDPANLAMVQTYREALGCEALREEVFAGDRQPLVFGDPEQWIALVLEALKLTSKGDHAGSQKLREQAFEDAPTTSGSIDGEEFEWIADADSRVGPFVEAIVNGRYYWIPFHRIREVRLEEPEDLRDIVWTPAQFVWANGGEMVGLIPTRYPQSHKSEDQHIQLARKTEWVEHDAGVFTGLGQRMLATDAGEYPLLDIRRIVLNTGEADG